MPSPNFYFFRVTWSLMWAAQIQAQKSAAERRDQRALARLLHMCGARYWHNFETSKAFLLRGITMVAERVNFLSICIAQCVLWCRSFKRLALKGKNFYLKGPQHVHTRTYKNDSSEIMSIGKWWMNEPRVVHVAYLRNSFNWMPSLAAWLEEKTPRARHSNSNKSLAFKFVYLSCIHTRINYSCTWREPHYCLLCNQGDSTHTLWYGSSQYTRIPEAASARVFEDGTTAGNQIQSRVPDQEKENSLVLCHTKHTVAAEW